MNQISQISSESSNDIESIVSAAEEQSASTDKLNSISVTLNTLVSELDGTIEKVTNTHQSISGSWAMMDLNKSVS